jgi:hypothetical protein
VPGRTAEDEIRHATVGQYLHMSKPGQDFVTQPWMPETLKADIFDVLKSFAAARSADERALKQGIRGSQRLGLPVSDLKVLHSP